jgi:hypothetical protein
LLFMAPQAVVTRKEHLFLFNMRINCRNHLLSIYRGFSWLHSALLCAIRYPPFFIVWILLIPIFYYYKEWFICSKMGRTRGHYVKWSKLYTERQML